MAPPDDFPPLPPAPANTPDPLTAAEGPGGTHWYFNREGSMLAFDLRVLRQAQDPSLPVLERLRFLTIACSNLDEFFEIRVAGLKQHMRYSSAPPGIDGRSAGQVLDQVAETARALVAEQYRTCNDSVLPALAAAGIVVPRRSDWTHAQQRWVREHFRSVVKPVLTPIGLDPAHPFPMVLNKGLCFLVRLEGVDAFGREASFAVVQVPRSLPRVIAFPAEAGRGRASAYVLLSSVIHAHVGELFPGMTVAGCHQFRITRDSDLWVDEEEVENLKVALQGELVRRSFGEAVRLEVAKDMPDEGCAFLLEKEKLGDRDLYRVDGPVNLHRLATIYDLAERPDLRYQPFRPGLSKRVQGDVDLFAEIGRRDILLHHPYQSFAPVVEFVRQASRDPNVLAIKQTLYRADSDSPVVTALVDAALAGKSVTALVELRARFNEAANIRFAQRLEEVGANVVYGIVGYKTHAKMSLVVRREGKSLRRYVHLATGNYHMATTRSYTDFGLLTARKTFGRDVQALFDQLTGISRQAKLGRLLQAPFTMLEELLRLIGAEAAAAKRGKPARITARMNSLSEAAVIQALYEASQAGVSIDLIVRGICCLRPGVPGLSENIRVRSIVGRFLEHSRVWHFHAGGKDLVYLSSADWMSRNLRRRIEVAFPIRTTRLASRVVQEALAVYLQDNCQAWSLGPDGEWTRVQPAKGLDRFSAQEALLARWASD